MLFKIFVCHVPDAGTFPQAYSCIYSNYNPFAQSCEIFALTTKSILSFSVRMIIAYCINNYNTCE